ncbi:MAG: glutamine--fructose-6-phosphate transaminase (isomerizing) [Candidatus Andersenbacteria bacterium]
MCGIVGYVGHKQAQPILLAGLKQLEYRGYDSAGIATIQNQTIQVSKKAGRVADLETALQGTGLAGTCGISHTRWATHGPANDINAHPHVSLNNEVAVVHNGVIENYDELRENLKKAGITFRSDTDTEVIAHLIAQEYGRLSAHNTPFDELFVLAVETAVKQLTGAYGIAVLHSKHPDTIISAKLGSPLVLGIGLEEHYIASDPSALLPYTNKVVYLKDGEVAVATPSSLTIRQLKGGAVTPNIQDITWSPDDVSKGDFEHYMHKEIHEQTQTIRNAMRGHVNETRDSARFGGLNLDSKELAEIKRVIFTACGTSWHSALFGEYLLEEFSRLPVEVEYASELRYRNSPIEDNTLFFCISQSGETADTLAALQEFKGKEIPTLGIVNVVGSTIAREATGGIYLHAGPEIGVASTKAFTSQLTILILLGIYFGRLHNLSATEGAKMIKKLEQIPALVEKTLQTEEQIKAIALKYKDVHNMLYLGRGYNFPVALEGALKLKEVSYIHAEGYPAAEMKHGPIALVDEDTPSVVINPKSALYDKVMNNLEEIKARKGPVIAIASEGDTQIAKKADDIISIPHVDDFLQPLLTVIPLQLLAYHMAILRGCDVDKPRNLAKSVTVE